MGRAPCCDKANVKKGPWSPEEDAKLKSYIEQHGTGGNWIALPQKIGLKRCGKSCRLRWLNYLRPNIKHGGFSEEEDNIICSLYISIGSRWSIIAAQLPGRTDNDIKNYWNTRLKKKLFGKQRQARSLKQEMIRKTSDQNYPSIMGSDHDHNINNPNELLPALVPVPYSNLQAGFNDHASIRKLLIKLGGRFSDDQSIQPPYQALADTTYASDQLVLANTQYNTDGEGGLQMMMLPDHQSSFSPADQEMIFNPQRLDIGMGMGMEFLYDQNGIAFGESNYWGGSGTTSSDHDQLVAAASNNYYI